MYKKLYMCLLFFSLLLGELSPENIIENSKKTSLVKNVLKKTAIIAAIGFPGIVLWKLFKKPSFDDGSNTQKKCNSKNNQQINIQSKINTVKRLSDDQKNFQKRHSDEEETIQKKHLIEGINPEEKSAKFIDNTEKIPVKVFNHSKQEIYDNSVKVQDVILNGDELKNKQKEYTFYSLSSENVIFGLKKNQSIDEFCVQIYFMLSNMSVNHYVLGKNKKMNIWLIFFMGLILHAMPLVLKVFR